MAIPGSLQEVPERRASIPARHIAAVVVGNALEFYDFLTYAFFAVYIGRAFFPSNSPSGSLLASLATFGAGFITRPIGSMVIGRMGDTAGRKPAMILSFSLMGVAIVGLALTPPLKMIGVAAPILVIFFRLLQGFALGGEVGPSTAFLLEAAPPHRRGFYASFQAWTQDLSVLASGLVGFGLARFLSEKQLQDFGWRIAFLIGAAIVPFGLLIRRNLPETFQIREGAKRAGTPMRPFLGVAALGLIVLASGTIGTYIRNYMTTYAIATLHMPAKAAFAATIVAGLSGVCLDLVSGVLSDRIGRKAMMLIPALLLLISILPAFYVISHFRTTATLLGATAVMSILASLSASQIVIWLSESFPPAIRSGGVSVVYAFAIAIFGGTTQFTVTWLIKVTGNPLAPAWYWTVAAIVGVGAISATRETAPRKLRNQNSIEFVPSNLLDAE
jgi:MHS family citrate/tricarballylate:H+ symporter-like MFS transporter